MDFNTYTFKDEVIENDPYHAYRQELQLQKPAIVIDNGSYKCRVGYATDEVPCLEFKNMVGKQRDKSKRDSTATDIAVGNDIQNLEVIRYQLKTQFDKDVVTHFESQEHILDHIFNHLNINSDGSVNHPLVLTEALCNPNYCRQQMSELLFECYHVPSVCYGIDGLFNYNCFASKDSVSGVVISCGYTTTYIMPVLRGQLQVSRCRRLRVGGAHIDFLLQRLLQLKYPAHMSVLTLSRAEEAVKKHCYLAMDYMDELKNWRDEVYSQKNCHIIQLPYIEANVKKLTPEQQHERRDAQIQRLKTLAAGKRQEKMENDQKELKKLLDIQDMEDEDYRAFARSLKNLGIADANDLQERIDNLEERITKCKMKFLADEAEALGSAAFSLLNVEDDDLDIEQIALKRKQQQMKAALDAHHKQRKKEDKKELAFNPPVDKKEFDAWLFAQRKSRQDLLVKREKRRQRKVEMSKRRSYASQQRMKIITELAQGVKRKKEDTFGMLDTDWDVYKQIQKGGDDSDSEMEQEKLDEIELVLKEFDPQFIDLKTQAMPSTFNIKEYYRLYLSTERIRAPEVLFQPSLLGIDQAGIAETLNFVLNKFDAVEQQELVQNVFITGSPAAIPGFQERMEKELRAMRPWKSSFAVSISPEPILGAWRGACHFATTADESSYITRQDYEEFGGEYVKEHSASNKLFSTPGTGIDFG